MLPIFSSQPVHSRTPPSPWRSRVPQQAGLLLLRRMSEQRRISSPQARQHSLANDLQPLAQSVINGVDINSLNNMVEDSSQLAFVVS